MLIVCPNTVTLTIESVFSFLHVMSRHKNSKISLLLEPFDMVPYVASRLGIQADCRLIEKQHLWLMQQATGNL